MACQWSFNGALLAGATNTMLSLANVQASEAGTYSVSISNLINVVNTSVPLYLNSPTLTITAQPQSQTISDGASASFSVGAAGSGTLTYQWQFAGAPIAGATNAILSLSAVHTNQGGSYSVRVTDVNGPRCACATLTVSPMPAILRGPVSQTVATGQPLTLNAATAGSPVLRHQWQRNHLDIADATNSTLTIPSFQSGDEGDYRLVVVNSFGSVVSADARVMIGSVPRLNSVVTRLDRSFQFQFIGLADVDYVVQGSTNLVDWQTLGGVTSTNGYIDFVDTAATNFKTRYYRGLQSQ